MAEELEYVGNVTRLQNDLFNASVAGRIVEGVMDPTLIWDRSGFLTSFEAVTEKDIVGPMKRVNSSGQDSSAGRSEFKKQMPIHTSGTIYPTLETEGYKIEHYSTSEYGIGVQFDESVRDSNQFNVRRITQMYEDLGRNLSEWTNMDVLNGAINNFSYTGGAELEAYLANSSDFGYDTTYGFLAGTLTTGMWNTDSADYLSDILDLKDAFSKQAGYNYQLDRMYMDVTRLREIKEWLYINGHSWEQSPLGAGLGRENISFEGVTMVGMKDIDGFDGNEEYIILQDSSVVPCTTYYMTKIYPGFSRWSPNAKVSAKTFVANEETNTLKSVFRIDLRTIIYQPKAYGVIKVTS